MSRTFPLYRQRDAMDCGPTCLLMVSAYYGKRLTLPYLRERSHISREGVSALGIQEAAKVIGLNPMTVKVPFKSSNGEASLLEAPLPAIAHWNQSHFVVIYKANKKTIYIADPAVGKIKLKRKDFEKAWLSVL
jgi:ATP-binding cassette subfamily B protein